MTALAYALGGIALGIALDRLYLDWESRQWRRKLYHARRFRS